MRKLRNPDEVKFEFNVTCASCSNCSGVECGAFTIGKKQIEFRKFVDTYGHRQAMDILNGRKGGSDER